MVVVLALAWLAALAFIYRKLGRSTKLPPGPAPWPIVGNLLQLGTLPHVTLDKLSKKYGQIMRVKFGIKNVVVASSPKMAEEFLKIQDHSFASRPALAAGKYTAYGCKDMLWSPYGPHWKLARKVYLSEVFSPARLDYFEHIRVDERRVFLSNLLSHCTISNDNNSNNNFDTNYGNRVIVLKDHIRRYTLSTMCRMVLGDKCFVSDKNKKNRASNMTFEEFLDCMDEFLFLNGVPNIGDWVPFLQPFDLQGYIKRMKIVHDKFDRFHTHVVGYHKVGMEEKEDDKDNFFPRDVVDVLLMLTHETADPGKKITEDGAKALIHDLLLAGTDTSAATIEWAIHELLRHPKALENLREELDRVIGMERWVEENDYLDMPYLEAIIKESLRLHPVAPLLAPHLALENCKVAGYDIPKDTVVLINSYSIGRDPHVWENPHEFRPERFLQGKDISTTGQDFSFLPFGSGRRMCPGYNLGLKFVRTTIGNVFHGFDLILPKGYGVEDICMMERYSLIVCPDVPLPVMLKPRLATYLYDEGLGKVVH